MSVFVRTLPAVSITIVARLVILVAGFVASIITARWLGADGRGQYYAVVTLAAVVAQFGNLGLSSSNTFLAARDPSVAWPLVVNSIWVSIAIGCATAVLVLALGHMLSARLGVSVEQLWMVCLLAPAILAFTLISSVLVATGRYAAMNSWQIANAMVALIGLLACAFIRSTSGAFVFATLLSAVSTAIALTVHVARGHMHSWRFRSALLRSGVNFASRAYIALLCGFLMQRIGVALLTAYRNPHEIGVWSIAAQISDVLIILPTSVAMVLFPTLIRQGTGTWTTARQALRLTIGLMLAASVVAWLLGGWAISWVFGESFVPSYEVLVYLLPSIVLISAITILSQFVVASGFPIELTVVWLVGLAISVATGIPLVKMHGAVGAAIAQSVATAFVCAGVVGLTVRRLRSDSSTTLK